MRCYKVLTLVVYGNDNIIVLLGRKYDDVFVVNEGEYFKLVFVKKRKYLRVGDVLGKECIIPKEFEKLAREILKKVRGYAQ